MKRIVAYTIVFFLLGPLTGRAQRSITVSGVVSDGLGTPVAGASIQIKGNNAGTTADNAGFFRIRVPLGAFICINAVGFQGDTIKVDDTVRLTIVLQPMIKTLEGIRITGPDQKAVTGDPMHVMVTRSAGATITEFLRGENSYSGQTLVTPHVVLADGHQGYDPAQSYVTNTPGNTFYRMSALPSFTIKEDTRGNRYLLADRWGQGVVVTRQDSLVDNKNLSFNFDKIEQKLYATSDFKTVIELEKQEIKAFAIRDGDSVMVFDRVPAIDSLRYFLVLVPAVAGNYSLYRDIRTKFVKSDYHSDGMTESGKPYDEYVDNNVYYIVLPDGMKYRSVEMKKKYIKALFPEESAKVDQFFSKHRYDEINDILLKKLITFLNHPPRSFLTHH